MYLEIPNFLTEEECRTGLSVAASGSFGDGLKSAPGATHDTKHNEQLDPSPEQSKFLDGVLTDAFARNPEVQAFTQSRQVRTPMLSRYVDGMHYASHLDAPILGTREPMRSDLSMTVFLSDPDSYDGGALVLQTDFGDIECKPASGTAVIYSTLLWHEVEPVTRGARLALVTWFQSRVRDPMQRALLYQATMAWREVAAVAPKSDAAKRLHLVVGNMTRLWSEV